MLCMASVKSSTCSVASHPQHNPIFIIDPCVVTSENVRTMDNVTYTYEPSTCWTLASAHCSPGSSTDKCRNVYPPLSDYELIRCNNINKPAYAVFTKKASAMPIAMKTYIGGHTVEMTPTGPGAIDVKLNGKSVSVSEDESHSHTVDGVEILK